jgi:hypothetical protein
VEEEIVVRLERLQAQGNMTRGEIIRRQTSNLPPKALAGQPIESLGVESIGHSTAFLYDSRLSILGFEQARNGITATRFGLYLEHFIGQGGYDVLPIPTQEMWNTLTTGRLRGVRVRVAAPQSLQAADATTEGIKAGLTALKQAVGTHYVEAHLGMTRGDEDISRRRGVSLFRYFRRERDEGRGGITHVYADIIQKVRLRHAKSIFWQAKLGESNGLIYQKTIPRPATICARLSFPKCLRRHRPELEERYRQ